jgi:hypothetical protein
MREGGTDISHSPIRSVFVSFAAFFAIGLLGALLRTVVGGTAARMRFTVELPYSVADALRLPPPDAEAEVRKELALALYARGILGLGKARGALRIEQMAVRRTPRSQEGCPAIRRRRPRFCPTR